MQISSKNRNFRCGRTSFKPPTFHISAVTSSTLLWTPDLRYKWVQLIWYLNNTFWNFRQKNVKKCENQKIVVSSFGLGIDKMCAARILQCLRFRTWNHLRHSQRVKAVRNHCSHPLDLHPQQKQSIQLISRSNGKSSIHKKLDSIISGLDAIPDKMKRSEFWARAELDAFCQQKSETYKF